MLTDPIADMLTRIRNAHMALHKEVRVPSSKMKKALAGIMKQEGYIDDIRDEGRFIVVALRHYGGKPAIRGLKRISKPGRRVYVGSSRIPRVQNGLGICIVSTSQGVLEGANAAERRVGGELLCEIW
jgi:small subunit ribosomal protein S8